MFFVSKNISPLHIYYQPGLCFQLSLVKECILDWIGTSNLYPL